MEEYIKLINNIEHVNIGTKEKPFYVPTITDELKEYLSKNIKKIYKKDDKTKI